MKKRNMYKYLLAGAFALAAAGGAAQMKTSYFMEGSIPRYDMNPALTPMRGYVNMPLLPLGALGVNFNNNFLSLDNFVYPHQGGHVLFLHESVDSRRFMNRMPQRASLDLDMTYNLVGFGKYSAKHNYFWSFGWNIRTTVDAAIPKELFGLLKDLKNGLYDIPDITIGAAAYSEFALGFALPAGWKNLVVGGRLKLLIGGAQAQAAIDKITVEATETQINATLGGTVKASVFGFDFDHLEEGQELDPKKIFDKDRFRLGNGFKSYGAAIDIGAEMKLLGERLKVSFALNDLGFIRWSGANTLYADMDELYFEFNGYNLDKEDWNVVEPGDPVFRKTGSSGGYGKRLNTTMNIGAEYTFFDNLLGVGALSHTKFANRLTYSELTLIGTVRPTDWFTASVSHSLLHNKIGIFGMALNFHPRGVNFFLGADYIPARYASGSDVPGGVWPVRAKSLNFYFGLAFGLGRSKPWADGNSATY